MAQKTTGLGADRGYATGLPSGVGGVVGGRIERQVCLAGEELTEALRSNFAGQVDVVAAYLFGSQATGKARPQSDVDTAVLLSEEDGLARFDRRLRLIDAVSEVCGREADVIVLNDAPPLLQHQVLKHGRLLFERDRAVRVEFEVRAGKIYADLKPMRHFFQQTLFREIKEVGLGGRR